MAAAHKLQEALLEVFSGGNLPHCARSHDLAMVDHGHMGAHALHERHHMRGDDHRAAGAHVIDEDVLDVRARHGVDRFEGLVEHEDARAVDHRGRQADLLGHAGGIVAHHDVRGGREVECGDQVLRAGRGLGARHAAQHAGVDNQLHAGERGENLFGLRHQANQAFGGIHVLPHIVAQDHRHAAVRHKQAREHVDRGGLARAVGTDQTVERSGGDVEGKAVHGDFVAEALEQSPDRHGHGWVGLHGRGHGHGGTPSGNCGMCRSALCWSAHGVSSGLSGCKVIRHLSKGRQRRANPCSCGRQNLRYRPVTPSWTRLCARWASIPPWRTPPGTRSAHS